MRKNTIDFLKNQFKNVKGVEKTRVNELLKLYEDGHIFSKIAAQKAINEYLGHASSPVERELHFYKTMTKYLIKNRGQSVLHKREAAKKETKENIQAEVLKKVDKHIQKFESKRLQKYSLEVMMYSTNPAHATQKHSYVYKKIKFYLITNPTREFRIKAPNPFPSDLYRKFIPKYDPEIKPKRYTEQWEHIIDIMKTDDEFK